MARSARCCYSVIAGPSSFPSDAVCGIPLRLTYLCLNALDHLTVACRAAFGCLLAVVVVTGVVINPVVLPAGPLRGEGQAAGLSSGRSATRSRLPLPAVPTPRRRSVVYGLAAVDCRGRVADRAVVTALGWLPGTRLDIRESRGILLIRHDAHGVFSVTTQGHLHLPLRCGTGAAWFPR